MRPHDPHTSRTASVLMPMTDDDLRRLRLGCRASLAGLILMTLISVGVLCVFWIVLTQGGGESFEIALGVILGVMLVGGTMEALY